MEDAEIENIRQKLIRLGSELRSLERTSKTFLRPVELDQASVGRLSRMDAMQGQQIALERARRRQHELVKIERALLRIESGEYGYCIVCGEEIDVRRLVHVDVPRSELLRAKQDPPPPPPLAAARTAS